MCAIMGILQRSNPIENTILCSMQKLLYHRGPDDRGIETFDFTPYNDSNEYNYAGVAFNRLSIRDLSLKGHQPMWDANHQVMIAMNGEIYNADELRNELKSQGSIFIGTSDTEVLMHLYIRCGLEETLKRLDGAFAICIWDSRLQTIYLVRDRIGEKPLYYYQNKGLFLFASEYKAFYCHPDFKAELNEDGAAEYFMFNFPTSETTLLKNVYLVRPGTYLSITNQSTTVTEYWDIPKATDNGKSIEENKATLKQLIHKSVERRLVADKPIGIQLSGGVDSSYVAAMVKKGCNMDIKSYAIVFDDSVTSEEKYIDYVNDHLNIKTHKLKFEPKDFLNNLQSSIWHYEAPMHFTGNIPLYQLNKEASKEIAIMLCGDGADECMGGYYPVWRAVNYYNKGNGLVWKGVQLKNLLQGKWHYRSLWEWFIAIQQDLTDEQAKHLFPHSYKKFIKTAYRARYKVKERYDRGSFVHDILCYEIRTYMLDTLLRGDKMAMAASIELRAPLLMPELVEFLQTIPSEQLVTEKETVMRGTKVVLKSLCADEYGEDFAYRQKLGLDMPEQTYWQDKNIRKYVETQLLPSIKKRGICNYEYVLSIWNNIPAIHSCYNPDLTLIWKVMNFEIWAQQYLDNSPLESKPNK